MPQPSPPPTTPVPARSTHPTGTKGDATDNASPPGMQQLLEEHRAALQARFPVPSVRSKRGAALKAAGSTIALALLTAALWWADPAYRTQHFATAVGEHRVIDLPDGSTLTLDTATTLDVTWHLRSRRVRLERGRAQFRVEPANWRPLSVAAGDVHVRVVGTRFDVWRKAQEIQISVYQGQVAVTGHEQREARAAALLLHDGQRIAVATGASAANAGAAQAQPFDPAASAAWQRGQLVFQSTPLLEALQNIQRYRTAPIRIDSTGIADLTLSGVFDSGNTDQLLELLPEILPVHIEHGPDGSVLVRRSP